MGILYPEDIREIGGIQSIKCGLCDWELCYVTPEESSYAVKRLQMHTVTRHHKRFDAVDATVTTH